MKAVILAGGTGTRLDPFTRVTNKHLLPLYNKPVIFYPLEKLITAGIKRIMIVTSPRHVEDFVQLLGSGEKIFKDPKTGEQVQIVYAIQNEPRGIAQALWIAKDYIGNDPCILCLGDNIIEDDITPHIQSFTDGATVFLKEVTDPKRFGIAELDESGNVTEIIEKPEEPQSSLAVTGFYIYDNSVFQKLIGQKPSARGEYEITYINNLYAKEGTLKAVHLEKTWFDVGTIDSLFEASMYMHNKYHGK